VGPPFLRQKIACCAIQQAIFYLEFTAADVSSAASAGTEAAGAA
jgi:hypothetical protein